MVEPGRLADVLWELVQIPSPTGHEREVALAFARMLAQAGAEVEFDDALPDSPSVIGRLRGRRPGATLQLAGHLDHIDRPHAPPTRGPDAIAGRGAADMKAGLAGILETVRVLTALDRDFPGQVLVTAYGLHEAPEGDSAGLIRLLDRGLVGQAALVAEGPVGEAVVQGKGQSIWDLEVRWSGETCHELNRPEEADALLPVAIDLVQALRAHNAYLAAQQTTYPLLGPESLFIGQVHYGDFYNRVPTVCRLQGTRRWHPSHSFEGMQAELAALCERVARPPQLSISSRWTFVGESYGVSADDPLVTALRATHRTLTGRTMPLAGTALVTDANRLVSRAGVAALCLGFDPERSHSDHEYVRLDRLADPCRLMVLTVLNYLGAAAGGG